MSTCTSRSEAMRTDSMKAAPGVPSQAQTPRCLQVSTKELHHGDNQLTLKFTVQSETIFLDVMPTSS